MKKKLVIVLALIMVLCASMMGCGADNGEGDEAQVSNLILATGGTSGTYYPYGGSMAELLNSHVEGLNVTAQSTGASSENLKLIASGEADMAIVQNDVMDYAYNGTDLFEGAALTGFSAVCTLYPEVVQIVVDPADGVETIADLKGLTVSVGDAGSGVEFNAKQILGAYGLTFDDIDMRNLSFAESGSAYQDGQIDAFFVTAGLPNATIQEICATKEVKLISIEGAELEALQADYGYYTPITIPGGTYAGQDEDVTALSIMATLVVSDALDETLVYNMCTALFDNLEEFAGMHAKAAELTLESAVEGISIPFHAGAQKYFEEQGLL